MTDSIDWIIESPTLASFNTHLSFGLAVSGAAATSLLVAGVSGDIEVLILFLLGTIGSLLPDIDADNSVPIRICFTSISILFAFLAMFSLVNWFPSVAELLIIWIAVYLIFRGIIFMLFTHLTTHRGIFHSVPAALFFGFLTATASELLWNTPPDLAWLQALFIIGGYILHLLLDEIYSVNLFGLRAKRSLGSACKLWYRKSLPATLYMYLAAIVFYLLTPSTLPLQDLIQNSKLTNTLEQGLLPQQGWFKLRSPSAVIKTKASVTDSEKLPR